MKLSLLNADQFSARAASVCLVVAAVISFFGCSDGPTAGPGNLPVSQEPAPVTAQIQKVAGNSTFAMSAQATATQEEASTQANSTVQQTAAIQESDPVETQQPAGVLEKAGDLFDRAKSTTGATAKGAKDWVQDKIGGAADASSAASQDTLKWATDTFESLKSKGLTTANDTSEWLSQDWKNMESWEYKIIRIASDKTDAEATAELNELGKNGWECYQQSDINGDQRFYLKKRRESYLRHLPFKDFIKLVPLMQQGNQ